MTTPAMATRRTPAGSGAHSTYPAHVARTPTRSVLRGRRRPAAFLTGAVLVVTLSMTFVWLHLRADRTRPVLAAARPVAAGQVITGADLRVVQIVPDPSVELIPASGADTVVGRTAALPLAAGTLLTPAQVGPAAYPAPGQAVIAVPVAVGRLPDGITPGVRVQIITLTDTTTGGAGGGPPPRTVAATVVAVTPGLDSRASTVVSLLLSTAEAASVAGSAADTALILLPPTS